MRCGDKHQMLADNPERFNRVVCVIGREAISSGRHYWEVRGTLSLSLSLLYHNKKEVYYVVITKYQCKIIILSQQNMTKYLHACPPSLLYASVFDCMYVNVLLPLIRWRWAGRLTGIWAWPDNQSTGRGRLKLPQARDTGSSAWETSEFCHLGSYPN